MEEQSLVGTVEEMMGLVYGGAGELQGAAGRDLTLVLGNTRAGKSTAVNYVMGNTLRAVRHTTKGKFGVVRDGDGGGPAIGAGPASETALPALWPSAALGGPLVDAPGFGDNRGEPQDVANAFHIRQLISAAASLKLLVVSDINDLLSDNVGRFTGLMDKLAAMLPGGAALAHGMVLVFTKDESATTKREVCEYLKEKVVNRNGMKVSNRDLVRFFANNESHIVIVKMPTAEGVLKEEDNIFADLIATVKSIAPLGREKLVGVSPGLADKSRCFLLEARHHFSESREIDEVLKLSEEQFEDNLRQQREGIACVSEATEVLRLLGEMDLRLQRTLDAADSPEQLLQQLSDIVPGVDALKDANDIYTKLKFVSFVDELLQMDQSSLFSEKVKGTLAKLKESITQSILQVQEKVGQLVAEEKERRLREEEEEQRRALLELQRIHAEQEQRILQLQQQVRTTCGDRGGGCVLQ